MDDVESSPASEDVRRRLASYVSAERARLAQTVANRFRAGRDVPVKPFIVGTLFTAFVRALEAGDQSIVAEWVRTACSAHGYGVTVAVVSETCDLLVDLANELIDDPLGIAAFIDAAQRAASERITASGAVREDGARDAIEIVMGMLRARDEATFVHSYATGTWSRRLAERLGLDAAAVLRVTRAGVLHDIGKISTPDRVLLNPGKLDAEEWTIMQRHAAAGGDMLAVIPALTAYAPLVRSHHERIDGTGYPDRLAGDEIPLESRIVAVADAFDAMVTTRTYRAPRSFGEAMAVLRDGRGTQWDADVVDVMVAVAAADRSRSVDRELARIAALGVEGVAAAASELAG